MHFCSCSFVIGFRESEARSSITGRWRSQRMVSGTQYVRLPSTPLCFLKKENIIETRKFSCWLFQSFEHVVWNCNWILHGFRSTYLLENRIFYRLIYSYNALVSDHVCWSTVRYYSCYYFVSSITILTELTTVMNIFGRTAWNTNVQRNSLHRNTSMHWWTGHKAFSTMRILFQIRLVSICFCIFLVCVQTKDNLISIDPRWISGVPFPRNFRDTVKTIVRRLFRVYAHIYSNHFDQICALGIEGVFEVPKNGFEKLLTSCIS